MKGLLVRVGIDTTCGNWNGPVDQETNNFVYVPIPENRDAAHDGYERPYSEVVPALDRIGMTLPSQLQDGFMHLDPDFSELTYGDCHPRSLPIKELQYDDFIVFYASFKSLSNAEGLVYALIGFYRIAEVKQAETIPQSLWNLNAHTRRKDSAGDTVVRAQPKLSGRLDKCIPIGEYRKRAYRVCPDVLSAWGGLTVNDGYLQRSGRLPAFTDPERFLEWFSKQNVLLIQRNNP